MALSDHLPRGLRNQYIAAFAACLSAVTSASCHGWPAPLLSRLLSPGSPLPLTAAQLTWVISIIELGCLLSPLPAGLLSTLVGRKMMLLSSAPLFLLSWTLVLGCQTALGLAIARFIQGLAIGVVCTTGPQYLREISSAGSRGTLTSMFRCSWWLGFLLQYFVGPHLGIVSFTLFTMLLNVPFCLAFLWQPESPVFYLLWGDEERAVRALMWLRDGSVDAIKREVDEMKLNLEINRKSTNFRELVATSIDRKGLTILLSIVCVKILSGSSVIMVYSTHIFEQIPDLYLSADNITVALGVVMFTGSVFSSFVSDRIGRRPLLLASFLGALLCNFVAGSYFFFLERTLSDIPSTLSLLPPLAVVLYSGIYTLVLSSVSGAYTSELFRIPNRGVASSLSTMVATVLAFMMLSLYEPILHDFGMYANFYLYAMVSLIGCVYFFLYAPETKGKSFFQIRKELCGVAGVARTQETEPLFLDVDVDQL